MNREMYRPSHIWSSEKLTRKWTTQICSFFKVFVGHSCVALTADSAVLLKKVTKLLFCKSWNKLSFRAIFFVHLLYNGIHKNSCISSIKFEVRPHWKAIYQFCFGILNLFSFSCVTRNVLSMKTFEYEWKRSIETLS